MNIYSLKDIPLRILKLLSIILLLLFALVVVRSAYPDHHFFDGPGWFIMLRDAPEEHDYTGQAGKGLVVCLGMRQRNMITLDKQVRDWW
jgi:hypothetical protein